MKTFRVSLLASAVLVCIGASGFVHADVILNPTSASDNSHYLDVSALKTIDGSGLSDSSLVDNGDAVPASWPTNAASNTSVPGFTLNYVSNLGEKDFATITYDFATPVNISYGHFWQYGGDDTGRSLYSAAIYVSTDGVNYTSAGTLTPGYEEAATATDDPGVNFALSASNVKSVRLQNMVAYNAANAQAMVGFGEIRFVGTVVPEPSTIVIMISGIIGLLAYAWRKQK